MTRVREETHEFLGSELQRILPPPSTPPHTHGGGGADYWCQKLTQLHRLIQLQIMHGRFGMTATHSNSGLSHPFDLFYDYAHTQENISGGSSTDSPL